MTHNRGYTQKVAREVHSEKYIISTYHFVLTLSLWRRLRLGQRRLLRLRECSSGERQSGAHGLKAEYLHKMNIHHLATLLKCHCCTIV